MAAILTANKSGLTGFGRRSSAPRKAAFSGRNVSRTFGSAKRGFSRMSEREKENTPFKKTIFSFAVAAILFGIFYLYQVNDLASKGYQMREIDNRIAELKKINEKNRIREVELRSMYNIEKMTKETNLVSANNISYLELNGPIAMNPVPQDRACGIRHNCP